MSTPVVVANWKMNGSQRNLEAFIEPLLEGPSGVERVVCPPFPYLDPVMRLIEEEAGGLALGGGGALGGPGRARLSLGAQNCSEDSDGAHTGEVSAAMLSDLGCEQVILGHSERRARFGDDNGRIRRAAVAARRADLGVILCLGERERGDAPPLARLCSDLEQMLPVEAGERVSPPPLSVAYEPVWAIGTGRSADPERDVAPVVEALRTTLAARFGEAGAGVPVLYGGSVSEGNAAEFIEGAKTDGLLVGGASLKPKSMQAIIAAVHGVSARRSVGGDLILRAGA